ncbi:glycosyltransferase [Oleiphilus messinensis]|nr:glycosyltransferase [Oleiphilus messinensis]
MSQPLVVWLLQTGEPLHIDPGTHRPMRAMNLANSLVAQGHKVILWSSAYFHQEKRHRCQGVTTVQVNPNLEIRLIPSPGYKKNISVSRLWDHIVLAKNLRSLLKQPHTEPDVAFIGYPPIEVASVMVHWLEARGIPCILDVKDQWPHIFTEAFPQKVRPLAGMMLLPYFSYARKTMSTATALTSMADDFLNWAIAFSGRERRQEDQVVPLTASDAAISDKELIDARSWWDNQGIRVGVNRVCFVGSHSPAFDMTPLRNAAQYFMEHNISCEFVICGDGDSSENWQEMMSGLPNVRFPGWVDSAQIAALVERSMASIAPYCNTENFVRSIPNKVLDSLYHGLPILTPLKGEVTKLLEEHSIGLIYGEHPGKTLEHCVEALITDTGKRQSMAENASELYQNRFSYDTVYSALVKRIENLAKRFQSDGAR